MKEIAEQIFSDEHRLTTRKRAALVLREICEQHERVALLPDGAERDLSSILIAVDETEDWIVLDMPMPSVDPVTPADPAKVETAPVAITTFRTVEFCTSPT